MISEFPLFLFTTLAGLAAGAYAVSAVFPVGKDPKKAWLFPLVCGILLAVGLVGLPLHLGRPERMLIALTQPGAMIAQEAYWSMAFGVIPGITDKSYITNSYHVHVTEPIDAFTKLAFEAQFQRLSPGGAISYVEVPNMQNNIDAVLEVMQFIYDNIMYAELNTKSDYCQECGFDGEIEIQEDPDGKLVWTCPQCGNRDQSKMNVARRTCGYIGTQYWNQGRTQEIRDRVLHL